MIHHYNTPHLLLNDMWLKMLGLNALLHNFYHFKHPYTFIQTVNSHYLFNKITCSRNFCNLHIKLHHNIVIPHSSSLFQKNTLLEKECIRYLPNAKKKCSICPYPTDGVFCQMPSCFWFKKNILLLLFNGFLSRYFLLYTAGTNILDHITPRILLELCISIHIYMLPTMCPSNKRGKLVW